MIIEKKQIADLIPAPYNPRQSTAKQEKHLKESLEKFGLVEPIIFNKQTGYIVGGHFRVRELKKLGIKEVECVIVDLNEADEKELNIRLNANTGSWDWDTLANDWEVVDLEAWGLEIPQFDNEAEELEASEDDYDVPEGGIETDIVIGDLFEIGEHRLLCGDSTDSDAVARLMNGEKADMVFTDPPYGVNIKGGLQNTTISGDITQTAIPFAFEICVRETVKDGRLYFCGSQGNVSLYFKLYERYLQQIPRLLIWVKNGFVMKPNGYHNQYEIIFHGFKSGGGGLNKWFGGRTEHEASDVWRINRDASSTYEHPTQKPVALPERAILNSCPPDGLIYEPFGGSGSTMVAAHQLKRRCFGMELEPKYCAVIIDRMAKLDPTLKITRNGKEYKTGLKQGK